MFKNKRKYQQDQIKKWLKQKKPITKVKLAKKLSVSRVTLDWLISSINDLTFLEFKRNYANYKISDKIRKILFINYSINFWI